MARHWLLPALAALGLAAAQAVPNNAGGTYALRHANASYGPALEEVHYYEKYWPIGIAIASDGRGFASYTRGTYDYTVGVFTNTTAEAPFPSHGSVQNLPASQLTTHFNTIAFGAASAHLISVQALYITPATRTRPETLWLLDTGRPSVQDAGGKTSMPYAQPGGPKLVAVNITAHNDTAYRTYTLPADVHYPDSYLNDLRFDLRSNLSHTGGAGIAYLVDSSDEGRPGFIMIDLASGASWRRLTQDPSVLRTPNDVPSYLAQPFYDAPPHSPVTTLREGLDGVAITPDGARLFYSPLTSNTLYSIPTENLRIRPEADPYVELRAHAAVSSHGQRGANANGFEADSAGRIYQLIPSANAVYFYNQTTFTTQGFLADPRILWPDGAAIAQDGYIYLNVNQLYFQPSWNNGTDGRRFPGVVLRAKLPGGATKIDLSDK